MMHGHTYIKFCRILYKFTQRAKPNRIIGDLDKQRPHKWSSAVQIIACFYDSSLWGYGIVGDKVRDWSAKNDIKSFRV